AELLARLAGNFRARRVRGRELLAPVPGLAGIDQRDRVGDVAGLAPLGRDRGIGIRVPRTGDELDRLLGIGAGDHRPQHVVEIGQVDVVIADHDIFRGVGRTAALGSDVRGLHRVARIALRDRHRVQHARGADLVAPHLIHARHAGIDHVLLDDGRAHDGAIARHLVRAGAHRRHAEQDRVVAVIDRLDVDDRDLTHAAGVVAGPFAERPLRVGLARLDVAFDHDLGVGRKRQPRDLAAYHLGRPPAHAADDVELERAVGRLDTAVEEGDRIAADHHHHRHGLTPLEIFLAVDPARVALRPDQADRLPAVHLGAVGAGVEPVLLGIARDAVGAGADITAAVPLVPDRGRELGDVDVVAHHDVLEDGPVLDDLVWDDLLILEVGFAV